MRKMQLAMVVFMVMALTGCTNYAKKYDKNTLVVNKNGSMVELAVEDFKESSVNAEGLVAYIDEQIDQYNEDAGKKLVKKKSIDTEDMGKVKLVLSYKDVDSYNGFNSLECTLADYEDVEDAKLKGTFSSEEEKSVTLNEVEGIEKAKVLILSEATDLIIKGKILCYNAQVKVKDGIITTSGEEDAIIIFK